MAGHTVDGFVRAHEESAASVGPGPRMDRRRREERSGRRFRPERPSPTVPGHRERAEYPDDQRTCFERGP
jgi:dGTPase